MSYFKLFPLFALFLIEGCAQYPRIETPQHQIYLALTPKNHFSLGRYLASGIILWDGFVVTNKHVAVTSNVYDGIFHNGKILALKEPKFSRDYDLAFYSIDCIGKITIEIGDKPKLKDKVNTVGSLFSFSTSKNWKNGSVIFNDFYVTDAGNVQKGANISLNVKPSLSPGFLYDAKIHPGFSGGPVFDHRGRLIGVNQGIVKTIRAAGYENLLGTSFAYYIEDVFKELIKHFPNYKTKCF